MRAAARAGLVRFLDEDEGGTCGAEAAVCPAVEGEGDSTPSSSGFLRQVVNTCSCRAS
mgnify:CR=1 FL=1